MLKTSVLGLAGALCLAACAQRPPVVVTSQFTREAPPRWSSADAARAGAAGECKVRLGEVRDLRSDTQSMGSVGGRPIRAEDPEGWVRSSLQSLDQDARIKLVGASETADVDINVEILKAYILTITQVKATTVVLRVRYRHGQSPLDEQNHRGADDSLNWASGEGESRAALNRALGRVVDAVRADLLRHCQAIGAAAPTAAEPG